MAIWRAIAVNDKYEVSCRGDVRHRVNKKTRKLRDKMGYAMIRLMVGKAEKEFFVHRLVARAFLGEPVGDRTMVNHINCNRKDNRIENLEYVNAKENAVHSAEMRGIGLRKIPDNLLKEVRELRSNRRTLREISEITGLSMSTVNNCCQEGVEVIKIGLAERKRIYRWLAQWKRELGE